MAKVQFDLSRIESIIKMLRIAVRDMIKPASDLIIQKYGQDPFLVLISCILSLRTKDLVSYPASCRLFNIAKTPRALLDLPIKQIEEAIYPVGFFRRKAQTIQKISKILIEKFDGHVPENESDLLLLPGVGRKTMNLVIAQGFAKPALCVDTHVHRISNRIGIVNTKTPLETEIELKKVLPKKYWSEYSRLMVMWGQNICVPISPFCSKCPIAQLCQKNGVGKYR